MNIRSLFVTTRSAKLQRLTILRNRFAKDVPDDGFRYDRYVSHYSAKDKCGTVCCIAGWLPMIFPKVFKWLQVGGYFIVKIHRMSTNNYHSQIRRFFGMNKNTYAYIFEGKALELDGRTMYPAVRNMRKVTKLAAIKRIDNVIELVNEGAL